MIDTQGSCDEREFSAYRCSAIVNNLLHELLLVIIPDYQYGHIAKLAGYPRHARHVGNAMKALPDGSTVPWQVRKVLDSGAV